MLKLPRPMVREIIAHALEDDPIECCGIIAGHKGQATKLYRAINAEASPYRFNVDSKDLFRIYKEIEANEWDVLAIYHSHTGSTAYPSPTDIKFAASWPEAHYIIVSLADITKPVLRAFRIRGGEVTKERLQVV